MALCQLLSCYPGNIALLRKSHTSTRGESGAKESTAGSQFNTARGATPAKCAPPAIQAVCGCKFSCHDIHPSKIDTHGSTCNSCQCRNRASFVFVFKMLFLTSLPSCLPLPPLPSAGCQYPTWWSAPTISDINSAETFKGRMKWVFISEGFFMASYKALDKFAASPLCSK